MQERRNKLRAEEALGGLDSDYPTIFRQPLESGLRPTSSSDPQDGIAAHELKDGPDAEDLTIPRAPLLGLMAFGDEEEHTLGMGVNLQQMLQTLSAEEAASSPHPRLDSTRPTPLLPPPPIATPSEPHCDRTESMPEAPQLPANMEALTAADPNHPAHHSAVFERALWQGLGPPPPAKETDVWTDLWAWCVVLGCAVVVAALLLGLWFAA
jgi:hypothetical protein